MESRDGEERPPGEMRKTKIMVSDPQSGKDSCGVCQTGVGRNAIFYGVCLSWIHKKCSEIKSPLPPVSDFRCAPCLGYARPIDGRLVKEVQVNDKYVEAVPEFCYFCW